MIDTSERFAKIKVSGNTFPVKETLKAAGFKWDENHWSGSLEESRLANFKKFIHKHGLNCEIDGNIIEHLTKMPYRSPLKNLKLKPYRPHQIYEKWVIGVGGKGKSRIKKSKKKIK